MTRKKRTILIISLVILFLIVAPLIIFYSLGWRIDWEAKRIVQTGILYFKVLPKGAEIYIDGEYIKKSDFLFGSIKIESLLPRKYNVEIKKESFHSWQKELEIKEREVAEAKNIVLITESPELKTISQKTKDFFAAPDGKKLILKERADLNRQKWALKLYDLERNLKSFLIEETDISEYGIDLIDLGFSPDSKRALLKLGLKEKISYYLLEIDKTPAKLTSLGFLDLEAEKIFFNPRDSQKLLILGNSALKEVNLTEKTISPPYFKNIITCSVFKDKIYYFDNSGFIFKTDFSLSLRERLNTVPFPIKKETGYKIAASSSHILLKESNTLFLFSKGKFKKISETAKDYKFSKDSKKLVYSNNYEIWVLFLEETTDMPLKLAGEKLFLARFSEKINQVFWYTNHYLIFNAGNKIKVIETDDRDKINIVDLAEIEESEIFWNQNNKKLYILTKETLYSSEKLIP